MRVFQIDPVWEKGKVTTYSVLIINDDRQYTDTLENFELDSSFYYERKSLIYNDDLGQYVVDGVEKEYPDSSMDMVFNNIDSYLQAQTKRNAPPEPSLNEVKETKIAEMKTERDYREVQDIEYNGKTYDYDEKSRERLSRAQQYLEDNSTPSIMWTCADNTLSLLTIQDFKNLNTLAATRSSALHEQYNRLKIYINGLTSADEVNSVTFDTDASGISLF